MTLRPVALAAIGLLLAAFGQATPGTPIVGIPIGLEGEPQWLAAPARTDARGEAVFSVGPGRYSVFLTNPSAPAIVTVTPVNDAPSMTSAPIRPGRGRVYAVDAAGRRLVTTVPRGGGRVRVTLSVWDDTDIVHRQVDDAAGASAPVNGIGGTGGGRLSNRGRPENGETRATANPSGGPIDIESWSWGRIDRVNTVQACAARGGDVVMHEGVQQCRLPATARREDPNSAMGSESTTR